jgi:hypothetical protein
MPSVFPILTVRNRLDSVIENLLKEKTRDEQRKAEILDGIENASIAPKEGLRLIEALS